MEQCVPHEQLRTDQGTGFVRTATLISVLAPDLILGRRIPAFSRPIELTIGSHGSVAIRVDAEEDRIVLVSRANAASAGVGVAAEWAGDSPVGSVRRVAWSEA
jgi:hypothetical protein